MRTWTMAFVVLMIFIHSRVGQTQDRPVNKDYRESEYNRLLRVRQELERSALRIKKLQRQVKERERDLKSLDDSFDSYLKRAKAALRERDRTKWGVRPYKCPNGESFSECNHTRTKSSYLSKRDSLRREASEYHNRASKVLRQKVDERKTLSKYKSSLFQETRNYSESYNQFVQDLRRYNQSIQKNQGS